MWRLARQGVSMLALAGYLAGIIGVPLPATSPARQTVMKDTSQPFPCALRRCGCLNAAQCWRGCCCFTNREKLAWAAENNVSPPSYVVAAADREGLSEECGSSCCSQKAQAAALTTLPDPASANGSVALNFVVAVQARECRGEAQQWLVSGAVMPPVEPAVRQELASAGEVVEIGRALASIILSPPAPPPRPCDA